jgi:hypothetical protein
MSEATFVGYTNQSDIWNEGYRAAYLHHKSQGSNPYPSTAEDAWKRVEWDKGWKTGDMDSADDD